MSAGGRCEAAVTTRTRCGWAMIINFCELLHEKRFCLRFKRVVYKDCVRPAILYQNEAWCLKESKMGILRMTEIHGENNVWNAVLRLKNLSSLY